MIGKQVPHRAFRPIRNDIGFVFSPGFPSFGFPSEKQIAGFCFVCGYGNALPSQGIANECRDLSTAVVLRVREAQPPLKMTGVG
jgi:hypothetical protein